MNFSDKSDGQIRPRLVIIFAVAVGILVGLVLALNWPTRAQMTKTSVTSETRVGTSFEDIGFALVVPTVLPSVVTVTSTRIVRTDVENPFFQDPFFQRFFGGQAEIPQERKEEGLGSGVIVSSDGLILTNNHVVESANEVLVLFGKNEEYHAKILGTDPPTDLAVLKVANAPKNLKPITFGDSSKVRIGEFVLAIGNPFGVGRTVTMGIISATGRGELGITGYEDFIQTDAAINPGNSGGALIDPEGQLVGINTAILSRTSGNIGIGFAIPVNMARGVMDQIVKRGKVIRGFLGVNIQDLSPAIRSVFKLSEEQGALISGIEKGGPADKAGLERGDVVLSLDGTPIKDSRELRFKIANLRPGATARLEILRNGQRREVSVTLGERPESEEETPGTPEQPGNESSALGIQVQNLTPDIRDQLQLPSGTQGAVVSAVQPGSPAAAAGLAQGDVIQEVNRKPVHSVQDLRQALSSVGKDQPVLLLIDRGGNTTYVAIERNH